MSAQIENIVNAYKTLARIPSIASGKLNRAGNRVSANWSVRAIDKGKNAKYSSNYILDESLKVIAHSDFGTDVSNELLSAVSPKETYKAIVRKEKNEKDVMKQYLEVWSRNTLKHCIDLTALDIHGDVYADSEFGSLDWSPDETSIVYVAERKPPKAEPYIKRRAEDKPGSDGSGEAAPKKGEEFLYRQDWGEQLVGKFSSVIVVCRLPSESLAILDRLPESDCPGQVRFSPDGNSVVGVAWQTRPRRLGLIFCTNRPGYIFSLPLEGGDIKKLSKEGLAVRSPRFSPSGDLVWLQRKADGPHHAAHQLVIKRKDSEAVSTVIDIVQKEIEITNGKFHGIFCQGLPSKCFTEDGSLVFSTPQANEVRSYIVDVDGGSIVDVSIRSSPGSTTVLDVRGDVILASYSNLNTPGQLFVGRVPRKGEEAAIEWRRVSEPLAPPPAVVDANTEYLHLEHDSDDDVKSFTAIYFAPPAEEGKKLPLIVWPHGGPHSSFVNAYSLEAALYNMLGFACLQVNYRGSTGAGDSALRSLPGRCGVSDVTDCKLATDHTLAKYPIDTTNVVLTGGSHGGFLVTHLSGQYPEVYSAVVTRNPVTDVASFAVLRINYRGSTGQGDAFTRCLISHVGSYDVADCYLALTTVRERDSTSKVVLFGASYGGLVVGHLAAKYENEFKAMVMKNPLIDLATKGHYADNSDGCAVEAGFEFTEQGPVSEEQLLMMRRCSPLAHAHNVRAPTALLLGSGDRRVPCYQGLEYARRLAANGVETRVYMYDDNHSLSSLPSEMDHLINGAHWFLTHLKQ